MAARKSIAALASNVDTYAALGRLGARNVQLLHDSAVDAHWTPEIFPKRPEREKPIIVWLGRLESRKAPGLAIEAFAKARAEHPCELWIIGQGSLLEPSKKLAEQLGVSNDVRFWGRVPHDEVPKMLLDSDIFLFTSLRDTFPTVVLESMALGLPAVSLDHQGLRTLTDDAVIKVPVTDAETIVNDLAHALSQLVQAPAERRSRGYAAWENVQKEHLWRHRYESMRNVYDTALIQSPSPEEQFAYDRPS
jgi:glycosyltransferase involved in cell wall biosynthesis